MATSGTYSFNPRVADFVDEAFERAGVDPAALTFRHLQSARTSLGLMFTEWNRKDVKLWAVDEQTLDLVDGTDTYTGLASGTICILDAVIRRSGVDTPCYPMSRSEYAAIPNKADEGLPTKFYFERLLTPQVTFWLVPENSTDDFIYWRLRRLEDVGNAQNTLDVRSEWFEAVCAGLAARLALKFNAAKYSLLKGEALDAFAAAHLQEREHGDTTMSIGRR